MNTIYRASNGCYYTGVQLWHYYETGIWEHLESLPEIRTEVAETVSGRTIRVTLTSFETFPFDLPGPEIRN